MPRRDTTPVTRPRVMEVVQAARRQVDRHLATRRMGTTVVIHPLLGTARHQAILRMVMDLHLDTHLQGAIRRMAMAATIHHQAMEPHGDM